MPAALYLRSPFRTFPYRSSKTGNLIYKTADTLDGQEQTILPEDMIHVKGFSFDGLVGLSPVKVYAREVLGCDLAAQNYSAKFFANDSRPGGYLKSVTPMKDQAKLTAVQTWQAAHTQGNTHRMALLDGGLTWEAVGTNPEEAQFIQTRQLLLRALNM
jgi:HK97 family phage portal protein